MCRTGDEHFKKSRKEDTQYGGTGRDSRVEVCARDVACGEDGEGDTEAKRRGNTEETNGPTGVLACACIRAVCLAVSATVFCKVFRPFREGGIRAQFVKCHVLTSVVLDSGKFGGGLLSQGIPK